MRYAFSISSRSLITLEFLVAEFNGTRTETDGSAYQIPVTTDDHKLNVAS